MMSLVPPLPENLPNGTQRVSGSLRQSFFFVYLCNNREEMDVNTWLLDYFKQHKIGHK